MNMRFVTLWLAFLALAVSPPLGRAQEAPSETASLVEQTETLATELLQLETEARELYQKAQAAEGEEQLIIEEQLKRRGQKIRESLDPFVDNIISLREQGQDVASLISRAETLLATATRLLKSEIDNYQNRISELTKKREEAGGGGSLELEQELTRASMDYDRMLASYALASDYKESLGLDAKPDFVYLDNQLKERADALSGQVTLSRKRVSELESALAKAAEEEKAAINTNLTAVRERLHRSSTSLDATVKLMDERGLETAELKQILISATGQITTDIFDLDVAAGLLRRGWDNAKGWLAVNGPRILFNVFLFLLIVGVFKLVAGIATRIVKRTFDKADVPVPMLVKNMAISFTSKAILLLGIFVALSQMGLEIGPLLAGVGVAGFIVGFALQETLSNFAAGLMILVYHPFDVGDVVEAGGVGGKVDSMSLVSTTILTFDNQKLIVPNNKIWGDVIRNKTAETTRRVDMVFGISYADDINRAEEVLKDIIANHELVLDEPEPMIRLNELGDSSVNFIVRPWANTGDYWTIYWDVTKEVKRRFDAEGISIPFPQRDVHLYQEVLSSNSSAAAGPEPPQEVSSKNLADLDVQGDGEEDPTN
jgi:small conductance mechanosensitive channel